MHGIKEKIEEANILTYYNSQKTTTTMYTTIYTTCEMKMEVQREATPGY